MIGRVNSRKKDWDIIVIGGGATGIGCATDAAARGFDVLLLEQNDFGKGTSSRSTKLVHGGVRYLKQGDISLVRESLRERGILLQNAPHVVEKLAFVVPCYSVWEKLFYGIGLKIYDLLSGKLSLGKSRLLNRKEVLKLLPNIRQKNLSGGVSYFDGQFDDTRLLIDLVKTAHEKGATLLNYAPVFGLRKNNDGNISGVNFTDSETGELFEAKAKVVINATGAFCDTVRKFADKNSEDLITPSQGIHLVFDATFLGGETAIMIPKTKDGRVLFAIPFHGKTLVGTTDTEITTATLEPFALETEIEFILDTVKNYLTNPPQRKDILSVFTGIRPLVKATNAKNTAKLSRDHTIEIDQANLLTITGGKWTTFRSMAEDAVDHASKIAGLEKHSCETRELKVKDFSASEITALIAQDASLGTKIHPDFEYKLAHVVYSVRCEMARTVEDVLARRTRILFLDARAALDSAAKVAKLMAKELNQDQNWIDSQMIEFEKTARNFSPETRS